MKKILSLLILLPLMAISQSVPADATALENLQITNNTTSLTATKVNVQDANGVINTIPKSDLVNVIEADNAAGLPLVGEVGKIYVVKNLNKIYRWNSTFYQGLAVTDISGLQAQIDSKANDSDVVKLTGNQTISGQKSFSLTGKIDMQTNNAFPAISVTTLGSNGQSAAVFMNNSSSPYSSALRLQTGSSGGVGNMALNVSNQSSIGTGIFSDASNGGVSISSQSGNGDSYISNITSGGTGRNYVGRNNGTETYSVDKTGNVTGNFFIKRSSPINNILLAGGGDLAQNTAFNKNFGTTAGTVVEGGTLGSNAYNSTAYLPLSGGELNGLVSLSNNSYFEGGSVNGIRFNNNSGTENNLVIADNGNVTARGNVTASPATASNHLVTKAQLDASVTSRPYKVYTALLSQSGTNAPVATVLENTLGGTVVYSYSSEGQYKATLTGAFTPSKTYVSLTPDGTTPSFIGARRSNNNDISIITRLSTGIPSDLLLDVVSIEIRVYL